MLVAHVRIRRHLIVLWLLVRWSLHAWRSTAPKRLLVVHVVLVWSTMTSVGLLVTTTMVERVTSASVVVLIVMLAIVSLLVVVITTVLWHYC